MFSRYLLILLSFGVAVYRAMQGAYLASAGALALAVGLAVLKAAETRPSIKPLAWACFAVTAVSIAIILAQRQ